MNRITKLFLLTIALTASSFASAERLNLPQRQSPTPETTNGIPHVQIGVEPAPEILTELLNNVSAMPGIEIHPTIVSLPGALGFWVADDISLARPDVIVNGREFAHVHPDGSLHASLDPELAERAVETGWAVYHPFAQNVPGRDGFVMIFTPTSMTELDVVLKLVRESFHFVTDQSSDSL